MALATPTWDSFALACFAADGSREHNQVCCDAGIEAACPVYTYNNVLNDCSVMPYDPNALFAEFQYGRTLDDCCKGYQYTEDEALLEACEDDPTNDALCTLEVFEPMSMTCDTVTSWRSVYMTGAGETGAITYYSTHTDSTPLRCCLKDDEWHQNVDACTGVDEQEVTYSIEVNTGNCIETTCTRYNLYLP